eukprot:TRINITY_DN9514_c0_g1_i1.p1 TRINITY_DN9514_c0_g1~~TRINITY_DN9514_c0_g1_i1.p1  ORF type:complete len:479 (-),score=80.19 TRINITY_DN9514_c0_g1_i1:366-1802(-)
MTDTVTDSIKKWIASLLFSADSVGLDTTDLSQLLKDGTVLCQVVTKLKPGALSPEDWISSPQSPNDYIFNIEAFLTCLKTHFGVSDDLLFKPQLLADYSPSGDQPNNAATAAVVPTLLHLMNEKYDVPSYAGLKRSMPQSDDPIKALRRDFFGDIITPDSREYTLSRNLLNKHVSALPRLVVRPRTSHDVAAAVKFAKLHKWTVDAKSCGNSTTLFGLRNNSMLIDFQRMSGVFLDHKLKTATVQAGARWADILRAVSPYIAVPPHDAGSGVGSILSGSTGPLVNSHGLPLDLVISAEIITADGEIRNIREGQHSALFWAIRGAGPLSFGIVTSYTLELCDMLVPYDSKVYTCTREWYLNDAPQVLKYCHRLFQATSFNRTLICDLKLSVEGCIMQNVFLGNPSEGKEEVKFFNVPDLQERTFTEKVMPFWKWYSKQAIEDKGHYITTAGGYVEALDEEIIESILNTAAQHPLEGTVK